MIKQAILKLVNGSNLSEEESYQTMKAIYEGQAPVTQISAFITALKIKGETADEIVGAVKAARESEMRLNISGDVLSLDRERINVDEETILETFGPDKKSTRVFNVSTATAFVVAASGVKVLKYGKISWSDFCGTEDVLKALGIRLNITLTQVERCVQNLGLGFLYYPLSQDRVRNVIEARQQLGFRTLLNVI
ncbi:MAG: anthranilate phosphoribosyltransferase, partial [Deltaproteobacteria bacterium]|nr:anthranilate phosphoribosyltransferase [Deltaproteobacteria bacterium]